MSCDNENVSDTNLEKLEELTNKMNRCNRNIKLVLELLQKMSEANEKKTQTTYIAPNSAEFKNKRASYLTKLNNKEIKNPKESTLQYYKIDYSEDTEMYS